MDRGAWWAIVHGSLRVGYNCSDLVRIHTYLVDLCLRLHMAFYLCVGICVQISPFDNGTHHIG